MSETREDLVQRLVTKPSFDDSGTYRAPGSIGAFKLENAKGNHQKNVDGFEPAVVEVAAVAPTGPNPKQPQQIPHDAVQTPGGGYEQPGRVLVAEVTADAEERLAPISSGKEEDASTAKLADLMADTNLPDDKVNGKVDEVIADLGAKTDAELEEMKAQEVDREKPRKGVISAIDKELAARK